MPTETSDHPDVLTRSVSGHGPRTLGAAALVVALSLSWSCAYQTASPHENAQMRLWVRRIASPAVGRCAEPFVARGTDGHAWLSWVERKKGGGHALRVSSFGSGTWSPVRTVAEGTNWFVNWADFPSVAANEAGMLAAHWLEQNGDGSYAYGIRVSCSSDGGVTWGNPFWIHEDRSPSEHGFASLAPLPGNRFAAVWLDGREMSGGGPMTMRATVFGPEGPLGRETRLDERVCECCCTAAVAIGDALVAIYRDRSDLEIRDISVVRFRPGSQPGSGWTSPATCHADLWRIPG